jgi:hypothetical protein
VNDDNDDDNDNNNNNNDNNNNGEAIFSLPFKSPKAQWLPQTIKTA